MIFAENMYLISMLTGIVDGGGPVTFGVAQFSLTECVVYICICCMRCVNAFVFANMLMMSKCKLYLYLYL